MYQDPKYINNSALTRYILEIGLEQLKPIIGLLFEYFNKNRKTLEMTNIKKNLLFRLYIEI
jgi:hypothetical protein